MAKAKAPTKTIYEHITDQMLAKLKTGVAPWIKPWNSTGPDFTLPFNAAKGNVYRGMNTIILWATASAMGYKTNGWMTMKQANAFKANVRKGEQATWVTYWKFFDKINKETGESEGRIPMLRAYMVFNLDQFENLPEHIMDKFRPVPLGQSEIENILREHKVDVRFGGNKAFFNYNLDYIQSPNKADYKSETDYFSTLGHEAVHWTGHESRLNRKIANPHGSPDYAREELVAEMGSAFLCGALGIKLENLQHAEYIGNWIKILENDPKAVIQAASMAQKAVDYLLKDRLARSEEPATKDVE